MSAVSKMNAAAATCDASKISKNLKTTTKNKQPVAFTNKPSKRRQQRRKQQQKRFSEILKSSQIHKNHIEIQTFLKSNYKYKRRFYSSALPLQSEVRNKQSHGGASVVACDNNNSNNTCCQSQYITQVAKSTKSDKFLINLIKLSSIVVAVVFHIVANLIYHKLLLSLWQQFVVVRGRRAAAGGTLYVGDVDFDIDGAVVNDDVNDGSDETHCQRNYDKLSTLGCQSRRQRSRRHASWAFMLQQQLTGGVLPGVSPPLLSLDIDSYQVHVMPIFMTLFIALALSIHGAEGGACWQKTLSNGKCNEIFSLNITKAECCGTNQEFSYTDRELSSVEYFFATAIGGGMECAPCLESCKNVSCGRNKKCAKRKGRPKCICAPECGAATRKRQRAKFFRGSQAHHSESLPHLQRNLETAVIFGKSARDIRSLSSEIQSQSIGLADEEIGRWSLGSGVGAVEQRRRNTSQRKLIVMQSQARGSAQSKREPKERSRLLIVEPKEQPDAEKTTTRRLQVISNINNHSNSNKNKNNLNHQGRKKNKSQREKERLHKQDQHKKCSRERKTQREEEEQEGQYNAATFQPTSRRNYHSNNNNNNDLQPTKNFDVNNAKLRHIHQAGRQLEDAPNHDQQQQQQHGRHQQFRKHKKKLHNKLKDQNAAVPQTTTVTMSGTGSTSTTTTTKTTTRTAPANSSASEQQRLLKHGSTFTTSSSSSSAATLSPTSLATSAASSSSWSPSGSHALSDVAAYGSSNSRSFVNYDDLTFDDRIYDKFNLHGLPSQQHKFTQLERFHSSHHHHHHPVCGTDGRTYNTECQLKKRACRTDNTELTVAYHGHCKTTCNGVKCLNGLTCVEDHYTIPHCIACRMECPLDDAAAAADDEIDASRAVCGVDGKTYRSVCDINRMICKIGRSIGVAYPGPCRDDRVTCSDINCGPKRTCLVDLLTHEPRCASCRYKCSRKRRPASLRYEESKICGSNNRNYNSWCEMRKDSCATGFFIDVKTLGICQ